VTAGGIGKPWWHIACASRRCVIALYCEYSQGIGKAIVEELAALGCRVIFVARSAGDVEAREKEWRDR
jgi:NADP-dependent 3-hydroxy acid dehydrogenase YdfG